MYRTGNNTNTMKKNGQIWVSAALYIAIGIIVITVVLSAGLPFINKIQTKNNFMQTKGLMHDLNEITKGVMLEGAGSKRPMLLEITKGELTIDPTPTSKTIYWEFLSKYNPGIELDSQIKEGDLLIDNTKAGSDYKIRITLDLKDFLGIAKLMYDGKDTEKKTIMGTYNLVIEHGYDSTNGEYLNIKEAA